MADAIMMEHQNQRIQQLIQRIQELEGENTTLREEVKKFKEWWNQMEGWCD